MKGLHDGGDGQVGRVQHLRWVQQDGAHYASGTVTDELRREGDEDTGGGAGVTAVP